MELVYQLVERVLFGSHRFAIPAQSVVQRALGGPRPASFQLDGHTFHCTTAHKYYFERANYERDLWPVLQSLVTPESVVYEVGAHFGFWVTRLANRVRHFYAFEPSPSNFEVLKQNVSGFSNVTLIQAAVGASVTRVAFSGKGSMSSVGSGTLTVPLVPLDDFVTSHQTPNVMLVDVEGYAGEVLRGAANVLASRPAIICEIHSEAEQRQVADSLAQHGYAAKYRAKRYPFRIVAQ